MVTPETTQKWDKGLGQWEGKQKHGRSSHKVKLTEYSKGLVMGNQGQKGLSSGLLGFGH